MRVPFNEAVAYGQGEDSLFNGSLAADLSQSGVRIRVQQFVPLNTIVHLKLHLKNPDRAVPVRGQVVWVREVPHSESYDVGIQFLEEEHRPADIGKYISARRFEA